METRSTHLASHNNEALSPETITLPTLSPTQDILNAQLLGEEEVRIIKQTPRFDANGTPIASPYFNFDEPIDFSESAIRASAFRLAAETLPRHVVEGIGINHSIPDNIGYQHPPSLDTIGLALEAWTTTGFDPDLKIAIEAMCVYSPQNDVIDNVREAMENAEITNEPITQHRLMVASRESSEEKASLQKQARVLARIALHDLGSPDYDPHFVDSAHPNNEEYHERLVAGPMMAYPSEKTVESIHKVLHAERYQELIRAEAEAANETLRRLHTPEELETLREQDVAVKVDMSQFFDD